MYQVQQIVSKRINPQTKITQYLVKWCGYDQQNNTWENQYHLKFVKNLINKFNQQSTMKNHYSNHSGDQNIYHQCQSKSYNLYTTQQQKDNNLQIFQQEDSQDKKNIKQQSQKQQNLPPQPSPQQTPIISGSSSQPLQSQKFLSLDKPPLKSPLSQKQKYLLRQVQLKKQQINHQLLFDKINKKIPPPLPPDFTLNKDKYNEILIKKSKEVLKSQILDQLPQKHKLIQKDKNNTYHSHFHKSNQPSVTNSKQSTQTQFIPSKLKHLQTPLSKSTHFRPYDKIIPPPPPPPRSSQKPQSFNIKNNIQPQQIKNFQNYQQNQQYLYNYQPPKKAYDTQQPPIYQYQTQNQQKPHYTSPHHNPSQQLQNLQIYEVKGMHRVDNTFIYIVSSNKGQLQLKRKDMVPRFSTQLVQFYQKYLTIED